MVKLGKVICSLPQIPPEFSYVLDSGRAANRWSNWVKMCIRDRDHTAAFEQVKNALTEGEGKVVDSLSEVSAIGHRIVQGLSLIHI